jgi:zinc transporter ZupT
MMLRAMTDDTRTDVSFTPLRPASRRRMLVRAVVGPVLWIVALLVATALVARTDAIEFGLAVAAGSFLLAALVLSLLRAGRGREERRYADRR